MFGALLMLLAGFRALKGAVRSHEFIALTLSVCATISIGVFFYHGFEGLGYIDAIYFSVVTLAGVGYGDITPKTDFGKIFTVVYVLVGMSTLLGYITAIDTHRKDKANREIIEKETKKIASKIKNEIKSIPSEIKILPKKLKQ